jgi:serine/threonine protein kinase
MLGTVDGIKLVDFGIARPYTEQSENTHVVSGGYSPPEQYWGAADLRSDIYALGATMYYLLTGKEPLALQTCSTRGRRVQISEHLNKVIQRATAQDVWLRFQSAQEMRQALANIPESTVKVSPPNYVIFAAVLALISVTCFALISLSFANKEHQLHNPMMILFPSKPNSNDKKESTAWHVPFEIANLANSEEVITDPEGLKPIQHSKPASNNTESSRYRHY